jgi:hypothetical protein
LRQQQDFPNNLWTPEPHISRLHALSWLLLLLLLLLL